MLHIPKNLDTLFMQCVNGLNVLSKINQSMFIDTVRKLYLIDCSIFRIFILHIAASSDMKDYVNSLISVKEVT